MTNEVFRFAVTRGIQRVSSEKLRGRVIESSVNIEGFKSYDHMPPANFDLNRDAIIVAARNFYQSDEMVKGLAGLKTPIRVLDEWLLDHGDKVYPKKIIAFILSNQEMFSSLEDLIGDEDYISERLMVSASLFAITLLPEGDKGIRIRLVRAMYIFGLIEELARENTILKLSEDVFAFLAFATIILPQGFPVPAEALARPPAIADLKMVKQEVIRYEMGDIAHIENVLKGESKSRVHRRKDIRE